LVEEAKLVEDLSDARAHLAPTGALRVGIAVGPASSAVWTVRDAVSGKPQGVTIDIGAAMAVRLGVPLALVEHASSGAIISAAASSTWDVAFTPVDEDRKRVVEFGPNYYLGVSTYMVAADSGIPILADVDRPGTRVVGVEDTATIRSARRTLSATTVRGVAKLDKVVALFRAGEADAIALGGESIRSHAAAVPRCPDAL
jgi:polar amino acid transport system substrate-binding protein